jgi:hypothetical protein
MQVLICHLGGSVVVPLGNVSVHTKINRGFQVLIGGRLGVSKMTGSLETPCERLGRAGCLM